LPHLIGARPVMQGVRRSRASAPIAQPHITKVTLPKFSNEHFLRDIKLWLESGGSANAFYPQSGWSLLHAAAELQDVAAIDYLIQVGADPNQRDIYGLTPLHIAVDSEIDGNIQADEPLEYKATIRLIDLGADPTIKDNEGATPMDWVDRYGELARRKFDELAGNSCV
jgi:ankyrin repeat protein